MITEKAKELLEVLIVDDGSKDNTAEIGLKYEKKYPSIFKLIKKENGGHGSAINVGIEKATGKYLRPIDADDWVDSNALDYCLERMKNVNVDMILTNFKKVLEKSNKTVNVRLKNVFNIGKSPLRNVTVNLTGAGLFPTSSVFLGDIQPGQAGYGELKVFVGMLSMTEGYTESYGKTTGVYTISYKDDAGEEYAVSVDFATEIKQPVIAGEKTDAEKKAEEEQKRAMSQWWISALAAFAAIAIIVAVIVVSRFARMMRMK